jgi:hypothetical protein
MLAKKTLFRMILCVIFASSVPYIFSQELSNRAKSLSLVRREFGSDKGVSNLSHGRFRSIESLLNYLYSVDDVRIPENTSFSDELKLYDNVKTTELKRAFAVPEAQNTSDDSEEECCPDEILSVLVGFALNEFINKKIEKLWDRNRLLNILKDESAGTVDSAMHQKNLQDIAVVRAEAQSMMQTIHNEIFVALPDVLQQVSAEDTKDFEQDLISESGLFMDKLSAILADQ